MPWSIIAVFLVAPTHLLNLFVIVSVLVFVFIFVLLFVFIFVLVFVIAFVLVFVFVFLLVFVIMFLLVFVFNLRRGEQSLEICSAFFARKYIYQPCV